MLGPKPGKSDSQGQILLAATSQVLAKQGGSRFGIACSGGLDSSVLLSIAGQFRDLQSSKDQISLYALYINHGLRPLAELALEEQVLFSLCKRLQIPLYVHCLPLHKIVGIRKATGRSVEEIARELRYQALDQLKSRLVLDGILLAHHAQDQAEQRLIRFLQGITENGSIPDQRGIYLRPFLGIERTLIADYADQIGLVWHEDSSNYSQDFLRNRVRQDLLPVVQALFPGYRTALRMRATRASIDEAYLESVAGQTVWNENIISNQEDGLTEVSTIASAFFNLHPALRLRVLRNGCLRLFKLRQIQHLPEFRFFEPLLDMADPINDAMLRQGQGIQVLLRTSQLVIRPYIVAALKKGYLIHVKRAGDLLIEGFGTLSVIKVEPGDTGFPLPLVLRSMNEDERLPEGKMSLKTFLQDFGLTDVAAKVLPVVEIYGKIQGVLSEQWIGYDIKFDTDVDYNDTCSELYKLKLKELGFST